MELTRRDLVPLDLGKPSPAYVDDQEGDVQGRGIPPTEDPPGQGSAPPPEVIWENIWQSPDPIATAAAIEVLRESGVATIILRPETSLPYIGYGDFPYTGNSADEREIAAEDFLRDHELALTGLDQECLLARTRVLYWAVDDIAHLHFSQLGVQGVPVYGANLVLNFAAGKLSAFSNRFYPMTKAAVNDLVWSEPTWLDAPDLLQNLPFPVKRFLTPPHLQKDQAFSFDAEVFTDRWILPIKRTDDNGIEPKEDDGWWLLPGVSEGWEHGDGGLYRAVWRVALEDGERGWSWIALVDAETNQVVVLHAAIDEIIVQHPVYINNGTVQNNSPINRDLDLGTGNSLATADRIQFDQTGTTNRFTELDPINQLPEAILNATTFYQLCKAQDTIADWFTKMGLSAEIPTANQPAHLPLQKIKVFLTTTFLSGALYDAVSNTLQIGGPSLPGDAHPIGETALDREVLAHELVHAALHYLCPNFFVFAGTDTIQGNNQRQYTNAVNEGVAYFLACDMTGDGNWAETAYASWAATFNIAQGPVSPTAIQTPGLTDPPHRLGVWWARLFWTLRNQQNDQVRSLLWQTLDFSPGPVTSLKAFALLLDTQAANMAGLQNFLRTTCGDFDIVLP